jgi:hypothetical protein
MMAPHGRDVTPRYAGGLLVLALVVGASLRIWQYAANTALWSDEIALATGIVDLDLSSLLTSPLPYNQVAPKGFLLAEKLAVMTLGSSDFVLRLVPLICSLISLLAFKPLATRILDGVGPSVAVALFATAAPFVSFGSMVKQYSGDVCVAVLLWWLAYELVSHPVTTRRARWSALAGAVVVWFSQPSVLMVGALGACVLVWLVASPMGASRWARLAVILTAWATSASAVTVISFASMSTATRAYVHRVWTGGFMPAPLSRALETFWPWDQVMLLFGSGAQAGLAYPLSPLYAVLTIVGVGVLWFRNRRTALLLVVPTAVVLGAAAAGQYPFSDRLILFLVPSFMLAIGAAVEGVRRLLLPLSRPLATCVAIGCLAPAVYPVAAVPPPYRIEDMKPVLSYVRARRQPEDGIYVYYGAAPATTFYARRYGLDRSAYSIGGCHRGDSRRYLRELDTFRGRSRVWVLLTHALPRYREREDILAYLDTLGTRKDGLVIASRAVAWSPPPAEVFLYDLSDDDDAGSGSADSFRLSGPSSPDQRIACGEGPHVMVRSDFPEP